MFLKMESEKGKEIYQPRFSKAESPFALGKEYLNMRQARARGVIQIDLQAKLIYIPKWKIITKNLVTKKSFF